MFLLLYLYHVMLGMIKMFSNYYCNLFKETLIISIYTVLHVKRNCAVILNCFGYYFVSFWCKKLFQVISIQAVFKNILCFHQVKYNVFRFTFLHPKCMFLNLCKVWPMLLYILHINQDTNTVSYQIKNIYFIP